MSSLASLLAARLPARARILTRLIGTTLPSEEACAPPSMCSFHFFPILCHFLLFYHAWIFLFVLGGVVVRGLPPCGTAPGARAHPHAPRRHHSPVRGGLPRHSCVHSRFSMSIPIPCFQLCVFYHFTHVFVQSFSCICLFLIFVYAWFFFSCWVVLWCCGGTTLPSEEACTCTPQP